MFNLSDMLVVFCFISAKQGITCSPKSFPGSFPEIKIWEFVESLRQKLCGGRFGRAVDGCATEKVAGEKSDKSSCDIQRLCRVLRILSADPEYGRLLVGASLSNLTG